jgi:5-methylcytosine-specific restriction endonuclease McrA
MFQRVDTFKRQMLNYGHSCCKNCFGKEQSFKDARKRVMAEHNSFKGKTHSEKAKKIIAQKATGRIAWNKGTGKKKPPIMPGSINKWIKFKREIVERDYSTCWKCGSKNRIEVHHIASKKRFPEFHYDEENCITLCYWCHKIFHKRFTIKKFAANDTINWLNEDRLPHERVIFD